MVVNFKGYKIHKLVLQFKVQSCAESCKKAWNKVERVHLELSTPKVHQHHARICIAMQTPEKIKSC
jgi:hypothetical protein